MNTSDTTGHLPVLVDSIFDESIAFGAAEELVQDPGSRYDLRTPRLAGYSLATLDELEGAQLVAPRAQIAIGGGALVRTSAADLLSTPGAQTPAEIAAAEQAARAAQVQIEEEQIRAIVAQLPLRDVAREALRARMLDFGARAKQRSAYEIVFIMLGFAVMLLVTVPALVPLVNAIRGHGS